MTQFSWIATIDVAVTERAFLVRDGVPERLLPSGRHRVWRGSHALEVQRHPLSALAVELDAAAHALVPAEQGDVWDAQWDMFLVLIGSILAMVFCSGLDDRALARLQRERMG